MPLLTSSGNLDEEIHAFCELLESIGRFLCADEQKGIEKIEFGKTSISRACLYADLIFDDQSFPNQPGPFKRAAAAAILTKSIVQTSVLSVQGSTYLTKAERNAWIARVAYLTIPAVLHNSKLVNNTTGEEIALNKKLWKPPTAHSKIELLALLRWMDGFQASTNVIDKPRICRAIMALALIIESYYYLENTTVNCDVCGLNGCLPEAEDPIGGIDMYFDLSKA